jgi:hypothetical protein
MNMKHLILAIFVLFSGSSFAGVAAFSGDAGEKMFIEAAPALGKEIYLLKFEGPTSDWAGKVIKVKREITSRGDERYSFDYEVELSSGILKKTYNIVTEGGFELIEGSRVKKVEIYFNGMPDHRKPLKLNQDRRLTEASQKINLAAEYKKSPFKPDPD